MDSTQKHLLIYTTKDDIIITKDGSAQLIIETGAVNFGLLSEREQLAIIDVFAQTLNSLSFPIQIVIHSQRLDITSYINLLDNALVKQSNPLLQRLMVLYKQFVQNLVKENDVLDKKFYIVVPVSYLEIGLGLGSTDDKLKKIKALLMPRRDQLLRLLGRVGIKASQLKTDQLVNLFYTAYNRQEGIQSKQIEIGPAKLTVPQTQTGVTSTQPPTPQQINPQTKPVTETPLQAPQKPKNHPFIVEELSDNELI